MIEPVFHPNVSTSGPWEFCVEIDDQERIRVSIRQVGGDVICRMIPRFSDLDRWRSDMMLIAAAPDVTQALRDMVEVCSSPDFDGRPSDAAMIKARAALEKVDKTELERRVEQGRQR